MDGSDPSGTPLTDFLIEVASDGDKALRFAENPERFLDDYPTLGAELRAVLMQGSFGAINEAIRAENKGREESADYYAALSIFRPINNPVVPINTTPEDDDAEDEEDDGEDDDG
jgi:hypothetical protein